MKSALLLFATLSLTAQIRMQQMPPADQTGKGSIEGNVLDAATHEPIKKASVMLNGRTSLTAITDATGHFAFRALPPGRYMIQAHSEKYPAPEASVEVEPQSVIALAADEQRRDVSLTLIPGASVRGRIVDDEGNPMPRCTVTPMRFHDTDMGRTLDTFGSAQSDDRGEYRISNISRGKYYIMARCFQSVQLPHAFVRRGSTVDLPVLTYQPQFYPGAPDPTGASRVEASPNANIAGIDFHMSPSTGVTVRGHVGPATPDRPLQIALQPKDPIRRQWQGQGPRFNPSTGEFQIPNVVPGSYELIATGSGDSNTYFAKVPVEVGTAPLEPIEVALAPAPAISGTISIEGDVKVPMNNLRVMVQPLDRRPLMRPPPQAEVQSDGTFTLNSVVPGHWRLVVNGAPGPGYLKSVTRGDQEVSPIDLEIGPSAAGPLKIVVGTKFAQIDATISTPPSGVEQLFAIFWPANGDPTFRQNLAVNPQGPTTLRNIPPGRYFGCAVAVSQPWALMQNRALLKALESTCEALDIVEGGRTSVQLRFISAQDLKRLVEKLEE
jgi:hypothetical protein